MSSSPWTARIRWSLTALTALVLSLLSFLLVASPASAAPSAPPAQADPDASKPTHLDGYGISNGVVLTFSAPTDTGVYAVNTYVVKNLTTGGASACNESPCVVPELENGTGYTFTVAASTDAGVLPESDVSPVLTPVGPPSAPTNLNIRLTPGAAHLSFSPSNEANGSDITRYQVSLDDGLAWSDLTTTRAPSGYVLADVTGLDNGTQYAFAVRAVNSLGVSAPTETQNTTSPDVPGTPTNVVAAAGDTLVTLTFIRGENNGSDISGYRVLNQTTGDTYPCTGSPCVIRGLTNGSTYSFSITATNEVGISKPSDASADVTPLNRPATPVVSPEFSYSSDSALGLGFTTPEVADTEKPSSYELSLDDGAHWVPVNVSVNASGVLVAALGNLNNGTDFPVRLRAVGKIGTSYPTKTVVLTPSTRPDAPSSVTARMTDTGVVVAWDAPTVDGGTAVSSYRVTALSSSTSSGPAPVCVSTERSCTFYGLKSGLTYTFSVEADNTTPMRTSTGLSDAGLSKPFSLSVIPAAPATIRVTPGDRQLTVSFTDPSNEVNAAVSGYQVSTDAAKTWKTLKVTGSDPYVGQVLGVLNGTSYSVAVRAVNDQGPGPSSPVVKVTTAQWFADTLSKKERAALIAIPKKPSTEGKLKYTKAYLSTHGGSVAILLEAVRGRQLQKGQAVTLDGLFSTTGSTLTTKGKKDLATLAASLKYTSSVNCEGYADINVSAAAAKTLSGQRATAVCTELLRAADNLTTLTPKAYGNTHPSVVGGSPTTRVANSSAVIYISK